MSLKIHNIEMHLTVRNKMECRPEVWIILFRWSFSLPWVPSSVLQQQAGYNDWWVLWFYSESPGKLLCSALKYPAIYSKFTIHNHLSFRCYVDYTRGKTSLNNQETKPCSIYVTAVSINDGTDASLRASYRLAGYLEGMLTNSSNMNLRLLTEWLS
jgi:hypothetical protein